MREIGIVTLLSVAVTAAAPGPRAYRPAVYVTPKTTQDFASCFTRKEDKRGAAWWYVPREKGGTISNLGAKSGAATYFVVINDRGTKREIALDQRSPGDGPAQGVEPMHLNDELLLDRRHCARIAVASAITLRPIGGFNHHVRVEDVSTDGCRVELIEEVELGEPLITRFPELEPLVGSVRWKAGATAGLQFSKAMHPAVLDHVVTRLV